MYFGPYSYTMTKSSAIIFILLFSLLFKLEEVVRVPRNALGREKSRPRETGSTCTRNIKAEKECNYVAESEREEVLFSVQLQGSVVTLCLLSSRGWHCCWWFCSSLGASSCSPTSPHSSMHRASCWCCVPLSLGVFAGLSRRSLCRRLNWVRRVLGSGGWCW